LDAFDNLIWILVIIATKANAVSVKWRIIVSY